MSHPDRRDRGLGRRSQPSGRIVMYREHARLIEQAAKASGRGQHGLAGILSTAAENVLRPDNQDSSRDR